jgi:hypothetical protein
MPSHSLASNNEHWGFWGTAARNGYEVQLCWNAAADALATAFDLAPSEVRDLLDSRCGRHLADDLSFIQGGPVTAKAIEAHIRDRLAYHGWRKWFEAAIRDMKVRGRQAR